MYTRILIAVIENTTKSVIDHLFSEKNCQTFDFCMCNPPFYTSIQELWESRSPARPEPKNGFTGSPHELVTEGGELKFCRQIIEESKLHKDRVLIFTTMVGHKYNLKELVIDLKADGITHTTTEFCQGRVTRWGLAWTYQNYDFSKIFSPKDMCRKKNTPILFTLPELNGCSDYVEKLKGILKNLQIIFKKITKRKNELILDVVAFSNTWSNQRRKRRMRQRMSDDQAKKGKPNESSEAYNITPEASVKINQSEPNSVSLQASEKPNKSPEVYNISIEASEETSDSSEVCNVLPKTSEKSNESSEPSNLLQEAPENVITDLTSVTKNTELTVESTNNNRHLNDSENKNSEAIVHALMKIANKDNVLNIEMEFLNGSAGKEGLHQIIQYIKNNWK